MAAIEAIEAIEAIGIVPDAPPGFHYRGTAPIMQQNGLLSIPVVYIANESEVKRADK